MTYRPLISVIIPVYNAENYLKECVDSILRQTYGNLDIVLVDDGSRDSSGRLCDEYAQADSRIQVLHKENGGLMSAWMAGADSAKGEYFSFVDSDDWVELSMIEELALQLSGSPGEIICSNYILEKENKSIPVIQAMEPGSYDREEIEKQIFPTLLGNENRKLHFSRCMKLISKELILDNMKYCNPLLTMGEDVNIILPVILDARRIVVMEKGLYYHYRFLNTSMAHKYNLVLYDKVRLLYKTLQKIIEEKDIFLLGNTGQLERNVVKSTKESEGQSPENVSELKNRLLHDLKKEYIFLFFYVIKNELRAPKFNIVLQLPDKCREIKADVDNVQIEVNSKPNQLLYYIYRYPNRFMLLLGRIAIGLFDRWG